MKKQLRVLQIGHVKVPGVVQDLKQYLIQSYSDVSTFEHPFSTIIELNKTTASLYEKYIQGRLVERKNSFAPVGSELFFWLRDVLWTWWEVWRCGNSYDVGIGMDCLNASTVLVLKFLGKVNYVVYYTVDVTDKRFSNPILSWLYLQMDKRCCQFADEVWDISPAVQPLREKYGYGSFPKITRIVPIGVYPEEYKRNSQRKFQDSTIVYLGSLFSIMGIQLAIRAMPLILRRIPKARLRIIGKGNYEQSLRELVGELNLQQVVSFEYYPTRKENIRKLFSSTIGIAPYTYDQESYKFYCDPTKVKEYFAAGLPVVITDVPDVSKVIATTPMGIRVRYDEHEFAEGVIALLRDKGFYSLCRKNIKVYIRNYSWTEIFRSAFVGIENRFL